MSSQRHDSPDFIKWRRNTSIAVGRVFGEASSHSGEFENIRYTSQWAMDEGGSQRAYQAGLNRAAAILESMIQEVDEYWTDEDLTPAGTDRSITNQPTNTKRVFVVHGRDEGTLSMVARFLEKQELESVILLEQPSEGRTVIEKFEEYAPVAFAVILCTPDDLGALATEPDQLKSRPRQNVVLEWGFFLGKIGRDRVCVLVKDNVDIPSDYAGVIYISMDDAGGWQMKLVNELKKAGLPVDANRLLQ